MAKKITLKEIAKKYYPPKTVSANTIMLCEIVPQFSKATGASEELVEQTIFYTFGKNIQVVELTRNKCKYNVKFLTAKQIFDFASGFYRYYSNYTSSQQYRDKKIMQVALF